MSTTEYQVLMLPINDQLEGALHRISKEGWSCVPGTFPMAIYNLQRKPVEQQIEMGIDDFLVTIVRGNGA